MITIQTALIIAGIVILILALLGLIQFICILLISKRTKGIVEFIEANSEPMAESIKQETKPVPVIDEKDEKRKQLLAIKEKLEKQIEGLA